MPMAIQLNDRDHQIFKLLEEHQVLLEKHIAWFVAPEDKPVLIRDRLRKLFYLDYLLCQRHDSRLSWWTTPTKPLVYMLAPLARTISGANASALDVNDNDWQRNRLEIANIRMIFLIALKEGLLQSFNWETCPTPRSLYDAIISCTSDSNKCKIGLISHLDLDSEISSRLLNEQDVTHTVIISRDNAHQESLQKALSQSISQTNVNRLLFATHQDLYKSGLTKVSWQNAFGEKVSFLSNGPASNWSCEFGTMSAA